MPPSLALQVNNMRSLVLITLSLLLATSCANPGPGPQGLKPDLRIKGASAGATRIVVGHQVPMTVVIKNRNSAPGTVTRFFHISAVVRVPHSEGQESLVEKVRFDAPTLGTTTPKHFITIHDNLAPGQSLTVEAVGYISVFPNGSEVELILTVDSKDRIDELDETNNESLRIDPLTSLVAEDSRLLVTLP